MDFVGRVDALEVVDYFSATQASDAAVEHHALAIRTTRGGVGHAVGAMGAFSLRFPASRQGVTKVARPMTNDVNVHMLLLLPKEPVFGCPLVR
ncbi:MAG: hypothetical protein DLM70_03165 [Chloroflexi bacterium]|nr:MAG: hypothetical protein DLM70_03165 [Chloroflexota bacterium]